MHAVYKMDTGKIRSVIACPVQHLPDQVQAGEEFFLNWDTKSTHIIAGVQVVQEEPS